MATRVHANRNGAQQEVQMKLYDKAETEDIAIDRITNAPHNPPNRTNRLSKRSGLTDLVAAIRETRFMYPPVVCKTATGYRIIDGHRRIAVCLMEGETHVACFVLTGDEYRLYALLNANQKALSSNDKLFNYLVHPSLVTTYLRTAFTSMEIVVGRELMETTCDHNLSLATFHQAENVADYCEEKTRDFVKKALQWLLDHKTTRLVRQFMDDPRNQRKVLRECIVKNKHLAYTKESGYPNN